MKDASLAPSPTMEPSLDLLRALYAEEVARAREMAPGEKLLEGPRLFDRACRLMTDGIRHRHPEADDDAVHEMLIALLARLRSLERAA
jgi:hypothetical protein